MPLFSLPTTSSCLVFAVLISLSARGQLKRTTNYSRQLSVITENDRYLMQGKDRYYSNGLKIQYSRIQHSNNTDILKKVVQYEIGQQLFTPYSRKIYDVTQIDRPVTGYLYGKYNQSQFRAGGRQLQWGVSVGSIGKASLGQAMQNTFHKIIGVNSDWWGWIWDYQLKSEPGINLHGTYARGLLKEGRSFIQLTPVSRATLGTGFTNISQGILLQLGKINPMSEGGYWNASIRDKEIKQLAGPEIFFYYHPELTYQLYNATTQGGLFRKDKGPIRSDPQPFMLVHQAGALVAMNRYTLKLEVVIQTKEASSQYFGHNYGGIHMNYRFN